jgi:antitoxin VapB
MSLYQETNTARFHASHALRSDACQSARPKPYIQKRLQCQPLGSASIPNDFGIYLDIYRTAAYTLVYPIEQGVVMSQTAKLFINGRSQAVRLPAAYRFDTKEVFIRQDAETGDVILSRRPATWDAFFSALQHADIPNDFLDKADRAQGMQDRDPFDEHR